MSVKNWWLSKANKALILFVLLITIFAFGISRTEAFGLSVLSDQLTREQKSVTANHDIRFRTLAGKAAGTITIDFNTDGFTSGTVDFSDVDLQYGSSAADVNATCTTNCAKAALAATAAADTWGATFDTNTLTLTYPTSGGTAILPNDYVRILIGTNAVTDGAGDQQITNPGTPGLKTLTITSGAENSQIAITIVDNDQVVVNGDVAPSITFSLTSNALNFGIIPIDTNTTLNMDVHVGTNATNGYIVYANDAGHANHPGMWSIGANHLIGSINSTWDNGPTAMGTISEGFGIRAVPKTGSPTIYEPYNSGISETVGGLENSQTPLAHFDGTMATEDVFTVHYTVRIDGATPAGSYTDTVTYVASSQY